MNKLNFIIFLVVIISISSFAQINVSLDVKGNYNKSFKPEITLEPASVTTAISTVKNEGESGYNFSAVVNFEIAKYFTISTGLQYTQNGFDIVFNKANATDASVIEQFILKNLVGIDIPLNFSKSFEIGKKLNVEPEAGLIFNFQTGQDVESSNTSSKDLINNFSVKGPLGLKFLLNVGNNLEGFLEGTYTFEFKRKGSAETQIVNEFKSNQFAFGLGIRWAIGKIKI